VCTPLTPLNAVKGTSISLVCSLVSVLIFNISPPSQGWRDTQLMYTNVRTLPDHDSSVVAAYLVYHLLHF
jgi:hypothetical protein